MSVISFVTQKGGSGKTTLAINCAVVAARSGRRVLLLDLDAQGSAAAWYLRREDEQPLVVRGSAAELNKLAELERAGKFDWIFIDTPGREDTTTAAAISRSDFCIIPSRPSPVDLEATPPTVETIRRLGKPAAFVLVQTPPRSYRIGEAEEVLSRSADMFLCPVHIVQRNAYQDAHISGLGVTELEPKGKAAEEIRELWRWVSGKVKRVKHVKT